MYLHKNKGIILGETILSLTENYLSDYEKLGASVETFYNCREQGFVLEVHDEKWNQRMCVWVYADRWGDEPTVTYSYIDLPREEANMYSKEDWEERTKTFKSCDEAALFIYELVREYYGIGE